jgi:hypothetical protein
MDINEKFHETLWTFMKFHQPDRLMKCSWNFMENFMKFPEISSPWKVMKIGFDRDFLVLENA